jgi:uncharacterized protein (TIGR01244 family)
MSDFRTISESMLASPQITVDDVAAAKALGVTLIVNNRPEGESPDQTPGDAIAAAARDAGIAYCAIPITHAGFSEPQVDAMVDALQGAEGKVLAYCRSGTRSTLLWSLAQAKLGQDLEEIARLAGGGGYDVSPVRPAMEMFAARNG